MDLNNDDKIYFAGKEILNDWNANFVQCFFGEHLLQNKSNPVAIVESEKTALIASIYFEQFLKGKNYIWLACGSLSYLTAERCRVLRQRNVTLFPDLKCYEEWNNKIKELTLLYPETRFTISNLLELKSTVDEKEKGLDLADYLIRFNYKDFQQ